MLQSMRDGYIIPNNIRELQRNDVVFQILLCYIIPNNIRELQPTTF